MADGPKRRSQGFFALDVQQFERIRQTGLGIEEAAVYLCLLTSTDQGNVTSSGGINSIMRYSGLSRAEAKRAIGSLAKHSLIECLAIERARARTVPRHNLPIYDNRRPLAEKERLVVEAIEAGRQLTETSAINAAQRAASKGLYREAVERLACH